MKVRTKRLCMEISAPPLQRAISHSMHGNATGIWHRHAWGGESITHPAPCSNRGGKKRKERKNKDKKKRAGWARVHTAPGRFLCT